MLTDHHIGWIKEFILARCLTEEDRQSAEEIVESFRKLWRAVEAGKRFRDSQTKDNMAKFNAVLGTLSNQQARNQ